MKAIGKTVAAINFYTSIFPNSEIKSITKYAKGEADGTPDLIKHGVFPLNGTE
jgi:predicted 3-demethylubiquinone-9 3-methyltransferase (glyoxalase superfamily)